LLGGGRGEPELRRRTGGRPRHAWPRLTRKAAAPHRGGYPYPPVSGSADQHGRAQGHRRDRRGRRLHQPLGQPALAQTLTAADFRSINAHRPSWRGGRDRQTWPRLGDQASAGRTPQRTEDLCGHTTGHAQPSPEHHTWRVRQFRSTDTPTTRRAGPPENTHRPRPTPRGPHRTHSCSLTRNG
jgi:hypothetical protein